MFDPKWCYAPCESRVNVATPLENQANTALQSSWPQKTGGLEPLGNCCTTAWKSVTLTKLFGGQNKHPWWLLPVEIDAESELMQALAEIDENECPDNGEVEILSEDEYVK